MPTEKAVGDDSFSTFFQGEFRDQRSVLNFAPDYFLFKNEKDTFLGDQSHGNINEILHILC
jgi:hypothetical protein